MRSLLCRRGTPCLVARGRHSTDARGRSSSCAWVGLKSAVPRVMTLDRFATRSRERRASVRGRRATHRRCSTSANSCTCCSARVWVRSGIKWASRRGHGARTVAASARAPARGRVIAMPSTLLRLVTYSKGTEAEARENFATTAPTDGGVGFGTVAVNQLADGGCGRERDRSPVCDLCKDDPSRSTRPSSQLVPRCGPSRWASRC